MHRVHPPPAKIIAVIGKVIAYKEPIHLAIIISAKCLRPIVTIYADRVGFEAN